MKLLKIIIDVLLLLDTILLSNLGFFGQFWHEVLGIAMAVLVVAHLLLNRKWIASMVKNLKKTNRKAKVQFAVDVLTMLVYLATIVFGVLISNAVFKLQTASDYRLIITHLILGRLAMIIMLIHLGMHLSCILVRVKNRAIKIGVYIAYISIAVAVSIYSILQLVNSYEWAIAFG